MLIERRFEVPAATDVVWRCMKDAGFMAACIPGCEAVQEVSPSIYKAKVAISFAQLKVSFDLVVEITREEPMQRIWAQTRGEEGGRSTLLSANSELEITAAKPGCCQVGYRSDFSVTGRLGKFGLGLMKKKVEAMNDEFVANFRAGVLRAPTGQSLL